MIEVNPKFIDDVMHIKEKYYSLNIMPCSGYALAILKRYIEELEAMAGYIFEKFPESFYDQFSNFYIKTLKPKLLSDLDSIQSTHQVDDAYERLVKQYHEKQEVSQSKNLSNFFK